MKLSLFAFLAPSTIASSILPRIPETCDNSSLLKDLKENGPEECCAMSYKPSCTMNLERMWHVKLFYNRKQGMSEEDFNRHWAYEHPKVAGDLHLRHGYIRYTQFHSTERFRDQPDVGIPILEFDGAAEFWVHNLDDLREMQADPDYANKLLKDEANFIDSASMKIIIGVDWVYIENGNFVQDHARKF